MDRMEAMSTFLAAVDAGSLSAASRKLRVPLATVSRRVSDLETHLRTKLLVRTSRRLELTDAGRSYIVACRKILTALEEAERAASGEYAVPKGELVLAAPIAFGRLHVLPLIVAFLDAYPEISVRFIQSDRVSNFVEDHIDVALRIGQLPDSSLIATRLGTVRRVVCASPAYLEGNGAEPKVPADLSNHTCITFDGLTSPFVWMFRSGNTDVLATIRSRLVVNTAEAAVDVAIAGLGITRVLSYQVADAVRAGKLKIILEAFESEPAPVHLMYADQGLVPLKTRAFIDFAAIALRNQLRAASDLN
jgi:DNA-binding transcriptional LysR family regulator